MALSVSKGRYSYLSRVDPGFTQEHSKQFSSLQAYKNVTSYVQNTLASLYSLYWLNARHTRVDCLQTVNKKMMGLENQQDLDILCLWPLL